VIFAVFKAGMAFMRKTQEYFFVQHSCELKSDVKVNSLEVTELIQNVQKLPSDHKVNFNSCKSKSLAGAIGPYA